MTYLSPNDEKDSTFSLFLLCSLKPTLLPITPFNAFFSAFRHRVELGKYTITEVEAAQTNICGFLFMFLLCDTGRSPWKWAVKEQDIPFIRWLHGLNIPVPEDCPNIMKGVICGDMSSWRRAAMAGDLPLLRWLHFQNVPTAGRDREIMNEAAGSGNLDAVRFLHRYRYEGCTHRAMDLAAMKGHLHVVQWLHENRTEGCSIEAMDWAACNGDMRMVRWLHERRTEGCSNWGYRLALFSDHHEIVKFLQTHYPHVTKPQTK